MSPTMSQKEAVFSAISAVLAEAGIPLNEGESISPVFTRELRAQVTNILVEGFNAGTIVLDKPFATDGELRTYCSGLQSNWLRKDSRLNGGIAYKAKNPGSRAGSGDASLKAMRLLLAGVTDTAERQEIQTFIDSRVAEVKVKSKPVQELNYADLPAGLADLAAKYK